MPGKHSISSVFDYSTAGLINKHFAEKLLSVFTVTDQATDATFFDILLFK